ncbi:hypothetical protein [Amycolatopsis tolypomycina]|uniref:hypothetical protein n=1 Tax=Amycolatopsis tolypomycina TaxID=208445 RepID=UPI0033A6418B
MRSGVFGPKWKMRRSAYFLTILMTVTGVASGSVTNASAAPLALVAAPARPANSPKPGDFGPEAAKSADVALDGWGDAQGYHLQLGRESAGFAWREVALIHPAGLDDSSWTGYQCLSGDGRYAAVAILPLSAVTKQAARDHGAFAYSIDLASGAVRPLATGVGLKYFSPGCGTGDEAVFTLYVGSNDQDTQLLSANLATGKIDGSVTAQGQLTSAVPAASGIVGVAGSRLVSLPAKGTPVTVAALGGDAYDLRPSADGGRQLPAAQDRREDRDRRPRARRQGDHARDRRADARPVVPGPGGARGALRCRPRRPRRAGSGRGDRCQGHRARARPHGVLFGR